VQGMLSDSDRCPDAIDEWPDSKERKRERERGGGEGGLQFLRSLRAIKLSLIPAIFGLAEEKCHKCPGKRQYKDSALINGWEMSGKSISQSDT